MSGKEPLLALVFLRDAKLDFLHASYYINKQIPCEEGSFILFFFPPSQTDNSLSEPLPSSGVQRDVLFPCYH